MVTYVNQTYCGGYFVTNGNIKSDCIPETNMPQLKKKFILKKRNEKKSKLNCKQAEENKNQSRNK